MVNPYEQFNVKEELNPVSDAMTQEPAVSSENPYAQFAAKPTPSPIRSDEQFAKVKDRWQEALASTQAALNAPFAGMERAVAETGVGAVQGAAQVANKLGFKNELGSKIGEFVKDMEKSREEYYADKPVSKGLDVAGALAGDAATFAALGGTGEAGYLKNIAAGTELGALKPSEDLEKRLVSSGLGGVGAGAGTLLGNTAANVAGKLSQSTSSATIKARELLKKVFAADGISPEDVAVKLEQAQNTGLPLTVADVASKDIGGSQIQGRNVLGFLNAAVNKPGPASATAGDLMARMNTRGDRIRSIFDDSVSKNTKGDILNATETQIKEKAAPAYASAFEVKPVYNTNIKDLLKNPDVQSGIPLGMRIQRNEADAAHIAFQPYDKAVTDYFLGSRMGEGEGAFGALTPTIEPVITEVPNMRLLDAAVKGLSHKINEATDSVTGKVSEYGRSLIQLKQSLVKELDNINPTYAQARSIYSDAASRNSAFKRGRGFTKEDPEDIYSFLHGNEVTGELPASEAEKVAYYAGVRRNIEDIADKMNDNANFGKRLWKRDYQKRIDAMFDSPEKTEALHNMMSHENSMANTDAILGNSMTAPRMEYSRALEEVGEMPVAQRAAHALHWVASPSYAAANLGSRLLESSLKKHATAMTGDVADEVTKILLSRDPNAIRSIMSTEASPEWLRSAVPATSAAISSEANSSKD